MLLSVNSPPGVAHEINNPLRAILCYTDLLKRQMADLPQGMSDLATQDQAGVFEEAEGSTIFLDEIADIPIPVQTKLLRVIQEREIKPLGTSKTRRVDVRIVASTNQDLEKKIHAHTFREDLFYRLNVVTVRTPSLSEVRADIPLLVSHFAKLSRGELGIPPKRFTPGAMEAIVKRSWPGNVRELQNFVRRAFVFCPDSVIRREDLAAMEDSADSPRTQGPGEKPPTDGVEVYKRAKERAVNRFTLDYVSNL